MASGKRQARYVGWDPPRYTSCMSNFHVGLPNPNRRASVTRIGSPVGEELVIATPVVRVWTRRPCAGSAFNRR